MIQRILICIAFSLLPLSAQQQTGKEPPMIRVSGEGVASAKPDQAEINIGVVTQASSADDAATRNAKEATAVIASLHEVLGQTADIRTLNYSLTPVQRYPKDGGTPTISGYSASNTVHVRTQNLAEVGKIIDTVTKSGANNIQGIQFTSLAPSRAASPSDWGGARVRPRLARGASAQRRRDRGESISASSTAGRPRDGSRDPG
jgi:uncharacterized protein YggE